MTARKWFGRTSTLVGVARRGDRRRRSASAGTQADNPYDLMKAGHADGRHDAAVQAARCTWTRRASRRATTSCSLKALAKQWGVKLNIKNLDFNGLIPGLVAKKFDMVSVGLSATPERKKSISFSRAYVPYAQILAAAKSDTTPGDDRRLEHSDKTITSLQGSTAEQLVQKTFPNATSQSFPDQNAAFLEVATGRADAASSSRTTSWRSSTSRTATSSSRCRSRSRCTSSTARMACRRATPQLAKCLNEFICKVQKSGQLAKIYKSTIGAPLPPMPACK